MHRHEPFDRSDQSSANPGLYLVVVLDPIAETVDAYGPMTATATWRLADAVQDLLTKRGPPGVVISVARFHHRLGPEHPDDP